MLDASAIVALGFNEPGRDEVEAILSSERTAMSAMNAAEAIDRLLRGGSDPVELRARWSSLVRGGLMVRAVDGVLAWQASELRARRYHRRTRPLSLADCVLLSTAGPDDEVASSDRDVVTTARDEGIAVRPLLDSRGVRPE